LIDTALRQTHCTWDRSARQAIRRYGAPLVAFSTTLALLLINLARAFLFDDEIYYMVTGQGYVKFLLAPNLNTFMTHVLKHLWSPAQEAAGHINHPFFAKLAIGLSLLISGTSVPTEFHLYWKLAPTQLFWARLPSALMASISVFVVCYLVNSRYGVVSATIAGLFLVGDAAFLQYSRAAMLDVYAAAFMMVCFVILISSSGLAWKRLCASALLAGLMVASKFTPGVFVSLFVMSAIVFKRSLLTGLLVFLSISFAVFLLVDFYYVLVSPAYLFNALFSVGRLPDEGASQGPLAAFFMMFSSRTYYSISHAWSVVEVALVVLSIVVTVLLTIKGNRWVTGIDALFLANITLGFVSFQWERPLVLLAPITALFVSTRIESLIHEFVPTHWGLPIKGSVIIALLIQLVRIIPEALYSNSQFMYHASCVATRFCWAMGGGEIVLASVAILVGALALSLLRGTKLRKASSRVVWLEIALGLFCCLNKKQVIPLGCQRYSEAMDLSSMHGRSLR